MSIMIVVRHLHPDGGVQDHEAEAAQFIPPRRRPDHSIELGRMRLRLAGGRNAILDAPGQYVMANELGVVARYAIDPEPVVAKSPARRASR